MSEKFGKKIKYYGFGFTKTTIFIEKGGKNSSYDLLPYQPLIKYIIKEIMQWF